MQVHEFDWYKDRLDLAHWESEEPGRRSGFFACPVHGGSDSLHVTEKNSKALITCFACGADGIVVTEALEDADEDSDDEEPEPLTTPVTIVRRGRRDATKRRDVTDRIADGARGVRLPAASTTSPLDWMAERCGMTRAELDAMQLPLSEDERYLVFDFPGVSARKLRGIGEGKKGKDFRWLGASNPPLWPLPEHPSKDVVICEGEADAICLRRSDIEAYSITKGSQAEVLAVVWEALRAQGVETVRLVFDLDDAGRKGRAKAAESARETGLRVLESRVVGIRPLAGEKDARDVALRQGYPLTIEDDADEDLPIMLEDIESIEPADLLLGRLHANEHTILFGDGGTGKGVIAAWWVARLTREERMRVLIVDYEMHANFEWRPRVERFGGDLSRVAILQPTRPIWEIAGWLSTQAAAYDYVVIDSVAYACVGTEVEKSPTAIQYSQAVAVIGKPTLSIAHVTKENPDPNHPFGSIFWSNGARVTIAVTRRDQDDPASPRVVRNAKTNQRAPFRPVALDWSWLGNDLIGCDDTRHHPYPHLDELPAFRSAAEATRALRAQLGRNPTVEEVGELGFDTNDGAIRKAVHDAGPTVKRGRRAPDDSDG